MTLSRYGDHHFWSIIIVYFFLPDLSTTHLPLLLSLPAFTLSPAPSYCAHLPIILFPYSVLRICLNLLPGRSFPFRVSPATSLRGSVQLLPRLRMKALDAGLPVRLQVFQPWTIGAFPFRPLCLHISASECIRTGGVFADFAVKWRLPLRYWFWFYWVFV